MAGFSYRGGRVAGLAAIAGFACWWLAAATGLERAAFCTVLSSYAKPPFFLTGEGSRNAPWELRTLSMQMRPEARKAPVVVSIGDDVGGVFQSSPPSPVDLAVVLQNLQRLGAKQAAIAAVMAWDKPDAGALKGLDIALNHFQLLVQAAPLSRGSLHQAMPPAFRRAALAPAAIHGNLSQLPIVNRVAVADVIFGQGEGTMAGFSSLDDADDGSNTLPLLARWEDENVVVPAFPLLAVLTSYHLPVSSIRVRLGESLRLGPSGPVVPIDRAGRMAMPLKPLASRANIAAEDVIVATPDIFPPAPGLIVLRDDLSRAPHATRQFSANLASVIASISSDAGLGPTHTYRRLPPAAELALLLVTLWLLALVTAWPKFQRHLTCASLVAVCLAAQWLGVGMAHVWLPGIPLLAATCTGTLIMFLFSRTSAVHSPAALAGPAAPRWVVPTPMAMGRHCHSVTIRKEPLIRQAERWLETACSIKPESEPSVLEETAAKAPAKPPRR
ncbi:MAG: hypothetical protein DVB26_00940 [Verrucomicrobia bacterium]|nr:MAG: hypothetical protein DVB26_00940 [Verrucomicrobiota bacterium]